MLPPALRTLPKKYFEEISINISHFGIHGLIIIGGFEVNGVGGAGSAGTAPAPQQHPHPVSHRLSRAAWS